MTKKCIHCVVHGLVQGVWYRATTKEQADGLGITGWVRNLPSGEVECVICGDEAQIKAMLAWLHKGPPQARVTEVEQSNVPCKNFTEFNVK